MQIGASGGSRAGRVRGRGRGAHRDEDALAPVAEARRPAQVLGELRRGGTRQLAPHRRAHAARCVCDLAWRRVASSARELPLPLPLHAHARLVSLPALLDVLLREQLRHRQVGRRRRVAKAGEPPLGRRGVAAREQPDHLVLGEGGIGERRPVRRLGLVAERQLREQHGAAAAHKRAQRRAAPRRALAAVGARGVAGNLRQRLHDLRVHGQQLAPRPGRGFELPHNRRVVPLLQVILVLSRGSSTTVALLRLESGAVDAGCTALPRSCRLEGERLLVSRGRLLRRCDPDPSRARARRGARTLGARRSWPWCVAAGIRPRAHRLGEAGPLPAPSYVVR